MVLLAAFGYLHHARKARIARELELTVSVSDNSPSDLSKFSDLERGGYTQQSSNAGSGVVR